MPASTCWRCLSRQSLHSLRRPQPVTQPTSRVPTPLNVFPPFSTTTVFGAQPQQGNRRGRATLQLKKKKRTKTYRQPAIGERKALRKRIVLSNTNALEVGDLESFDHELVLAEARVGQILALKSETVDGLRAAEAFKRSQNWSYFRKPCTLVRKQTVEIGKLLRDAEENKDVVRRMVVGAKGIGKSVLLLQAQAWALSKGWVVINFPEARDITNATTAYSPEPSTDPVRYIQKDYTAALLSRIAKANRPVLSTLPILLRHPSLPSHFTNMDTLHRLCELGARESDTSWVTFQALWSELMAQAPPRSQHRPRPPVMMSLDGLAWASRLTSYLAPNMHYVHAHDLALVKHFLDHFSGAQKLSNGGAIFAADSLSNRPKTPALDLAIRQSDERIAALRDVREGEKLPEQPLFDPTAPWQRIDERGLVGIRGVPTLRLEGLSKEETRSQLEYYAKSGMLRRRVTESLASEAWTLSGGGNIAQLERTSVGSGFM